MSGEWEKWSLPKDAYYKVEKIMLKLPKMFEPVANKITENKLATVI